jgi:hypothetical protein
MSATQEPGMAIFDMRTLLPVVVDNTSPKNLSTNRVISRECCQ